MQLTRTLVNIIRHYKLCNKAHDWLHSTNHIVNTLNANAVNTKSQFLQRQDNNSHTYRKLEQGYVWVFNISNPAVLCFYLFFAFRRFFLKAQNCEVFIVATMKAFANLCIAIAVISIIACLDGAEGYTRRGGARGFRQDDVPEEVPQEFNSRVCA